MPLITSGCVILVALRISVSFSVLTRSNADETPFLLLGASGIGLAWSTHVQRTISANRFSASVANRIDGLGSLKKQSRV